MGQVPAVAVWRRLDEVALGVAGVDAYLLGEVTPVRAMMATQRLHQCEVVLSELDADLEEAARTLTDPAVLPLLHRARIIGAVIRLVQEKHGAVLAAGARFLTAGDPGEDPRPQIRHRIRVISGGAVGQGRRR